MIMNIPIIKNKTIIKNKYKQNIFIFFNVLVVLLLNLSLISNFVLSQSEVNDLLIFNSTEFSIGLNSSTVMISDGVNSESLGNNGNSSWIFDHYDNPKNIEYIFDSKDFLIYTIDNKIVVYKNSSSYNYLNATLYNMNNYLIDMNSHEGSVNITITDLAGNVLKYDNVEIKFLNGFYYYKIDLSSLYDGDIKIEVNSDVHGKFITQNIKKTSFYNTTLIPEFFYINISKGNYFHEIRLKENTGPYQESLMFYNQNDKYYEYINTSFNSTKIFSINNDNSVILSSNENGIDSFYLYKYIQLTDLISDKIETGATPVSVIINDSQPYIFFLPDNNYKVFVCSIGPTEPFISKNCIIGNFSDTFLYNYNPLKQYLFLGYNVTDLSNHSYLNFTIDNSSLYNIIEATDADKIYNGSIYHLRFTIELEPGNYSLMINDSLSYPVSKKYRKFNTSLFINNKLNRTINANTDNLPEYHHYNFELLSRSNVSLLDSRIDAFNSHDVILSRYYQWKNFSKNIPVDLQIQGSNFLFSVCNNFLRNESTIICDYYLKKGKNESVFFSFDDPVIFIDYNITSLRTYKIFNFSNSNEFNFTFTLAEKLLRGSSHSIEYDNKPDYFLNVNVSMTSGFDIFKNMTMDWITFNNKRSDGECNVGYDISSLNFEYLDANGVSIMSVQDDKIKLSELDFYNNYLLFRKCYDGEWVPLYPRFNFFNDKNIGKISVVNEEDQCAVLNGDKDYYLNGSVFNSNDQVITSSTIISSNTIIENSSFANYHQCYNGKWISSTYQNFNALSRVAEKLDYISIYCDWTSNLDLMGIPLGSDFNYLKYPQGCVLKNLETNETLLSLLSNLKDYDGNEMSNLENFINSKELDFYLGSIKQIDDNFNTIHSDTKDFILIYNKNTKFETSGIKNKFSSQTSSSIFTKFIDMLENIFNKIFGISRPEGLNLEPRDYHAIFYTRNGKSEIYSYAYVNEEGFSPLDDIINYTVALEFVNFKESDIIYYNKSLKEYFRPDDEFINNLLFNVTLDGENSNISFIDDGIGLDDYRNFYNDLIPSLRIE